MNKRFQALQTETKPLFIPFIMAGDPTPEDTIETALILQEEGANVLELGIPYSDPLADGPVIQEAAKRAKGMNISKAMELVGKMRQQGLEIPVLIFTYINPFLRLGEDEFFNLAKQHDVDGLLIPDLPFEESEQIRARCKMSGISYISLVAPTTSPKRLETISQDAQGFLYCVSSLGVTGERSDFHPETKRLLKEAKSYSSVPVALGFGISTRQQFIDVGEVCDGVIIGSSLIRKSHELRNEEPENYKNAFKSYLSSLVKGEQHINS
ncbi:tryptophan synthase subunit alpha [Pseudalkalibacillus berkeleyi]|uniref:Tryptophan synthase alpha chain n=1 Tax=Pseudalkalibacillus berkeleyi TaxID=1069813 RepID=A0ABS9H0Y6_9BACL|nr:tryptophan synthase subunit alpha [Pseudalkalibacillus berkeleyi]MCF6137438.1 tryptophan synthase subunit alpha [Pseudalkalibacillus berkeleyi]